MFDLCIMSFHTSIYKLLINLKYKFHNRAFVGFWLLAKLFCSSYMKSKYESLDANYKSCMLLTKAYAPYTSLQAR